MVPPLAWPAAALVGVSLGMLGSGGSILTVPLLSFVGLPFADAVATGYPIVGAAALGGLAAHARSGRVRFAAVLPFLVASVPATFLARAYAVPLLSTRVQAVAFAVLMLVAASRMLARAPKSAAAEPTALGVLEVGAVGAVVGALTGALGVGGGFVIVPALVAFLGFSVGQAVSTSLLAIAANCATALAANALSSDSKRVDVPLAVVFSAVGIAGAVLGERFHRALPERTVRRVFAVVVVAAAAWLLVREATA